MVAVTLQKKTFRPEMLFQIQVKLEMSALRGLEIRVAGVRGDGVVVDWR